MSQRLRWPNHAEWAREASLYQAHRGMDANRLLLENDQICVVKKAAIIHDALFRIITNLEAVGPGKKPAQAGESENR